VVNGFILNRRWTFKEARSTSVADQSVKFMLVNIVGWMLNTGITVCLIAAWQILHVHSQVQFTQIFWDILSGQKQHYSKLITNVALLGATGVVVFWNFFANRYWTFKH
jgi:putative flippase GtrA